MNLTTNVKFINCLPIFATVDCMQKYFRLSIGTQSFKICLQYQISNVKIGDIKCNLIAVSNLSKNCFTNCEGLRPIKGIC